MYVSVREAAALLRVSERRVRRLAADGRIDATRVGRRSLLISRDSIDRRRRIAPAAGRPLSARACWALINLASGGPVENPLERARARARLGRLDALSPQTLAARAAVHGYRVHPGVREALHADCRMALSGRDAADRYRADIILPDGIGAYVDAADLEGVVRDHFLQPAPDTEANVILRAIPRGVTPPPRGDGLVPPILLALDLIDDADERSLCAGRRLLATVLDRRAET